MSFSGATRHARTKQTIRYQPTKVPKAPKPTAGPPRKPKEMLLVKRAIRRHAAWDEWRDSFVHYARQKKNTTSNKWFNSLWQHLYAGEEAPARVVAGPPLVEDPGSPVIDSLAEGATIEPPAEGATIEPPAEGATADPGASEQPSL